MFQTNSPRRFPKEGEVAARTAEQSWIAERIPPGARLLVCVFLSVLAFGARTEALLAGLSTADILLVLLLCGRRCSVWREGTRLFVWQTGVIATLYLIRFGPDGLWPGIRASWQLFLAFLPGMVFVQSVPQSRLVQTLNRIMPYRTAFVLSTSMRFIPLVVREVKSIHEAQVLRSAKILPRDLLKPWNWPDLVHCVLVPAIIQSLALAAEIARAARARDFGRKDRRTYWPGS